MRTRILFSLLAFSPAPLLAQVGHPPAHSPYRDIKGSNYFTVIGGRFLGNGGRIGIAPHDGNLYGARIDFLSAGTVTLGLAGYRANTERLIVNPFVKLVDRESGPVPQDLTALMGVLQFNLSGGKTWHGLAPYLGGGFGVAHASATPADTSGFKFGTRFFFAPNVGVRVFLADKLHIRLQAETLFWNLKYPDTFATEPPLEPGTGGNSNAVFPDRHLKEWTTSSVLSIGLGHAFSFPF